MHVCGWWILHDTVESSAHEQTQSWHPEVSGRLMADNAPFSAASADPQKALDFDCEDLSCDEL